MSTRVVDRVDEWDERSFTDGYRSLHELADEEFSGVVRAGGAELYMTKGTVVGIRHGSIEAFEDGTGTAYKAPSPALPLLAIMQETSDEVRGEYYSEKTAIAEVDSTLEDGGFTGYVELSDNVLSGDYYQVYHAGRSMSVGFVGASSRLIDGDEAFKTANDEVGIYQVHPADIDVIEIPEVESASAESANAAESDDASEATMDEDSAVDEENSAGGDEDEDTVEEAESEETEAGDNEDADEEPEGRADDSTPTAVDEAATSTASSGRDTTDDESTGDTAQPDSATRHQSGRDEAGDSETASTGTTTKQQAVADSGAQPTEQGRPESTVRESETQAAETAPATGQSGATQRQPAEPSSPGDQPREGPDSHRSEQQTTRSSGASGAELDLETRAIPSLDPERTSDPDDSGGNARSDTFTRPQDRAGNQRSTGSTSGQQANATGATQSTQQRQPSVASESTSSNGTATESGQPNHSSAASSERLEELEAELDEREVEIDRLESELDRKTTEYEDAKSQLEMLRDERDELATQVDRLEGELEQLETQFGAATDAERRMTPAEALSQTDIFPRYESKGDATLKKAHSGSHRQEDVFGNLRLEQNTQFDADSVSVAGQTYDEFLQSTLEYRFVNWVVGSLLFEIRETGHEKSLRDLYDSLPVIDWADLKGTVDVVYTEEGQETRSQESFDIVLRNRMGEPLIVANLNDSREGATKSMMENLIRSAKRVGQSSDAFAGAFLVTRSFFEPPALETADDATQGGLLSRDKRKSFVNLSRKQGYHLCLVEARNDNFTLLVPEL